jgi:hypothetical protein
MLHSKQPWSMVLVWVLLTSLATVHLWRLARAAILATLARRANTANTAPKMAAHAECANARRRIGGRAGLEETASPCRIENRVLKTTKLVTL